MSPSILTARVIGEYGSMLYSLFLHTAGFKQEYVICGVCRDYITSSQLTSSKHKQAHQGRTRNAGRA